MILVVVVIVCLAETPGGLPLHLDRWTVSLQLSILGGITWLVSGVELERTLVAILSPGFPSEKTLRALQCELTLAFSLEWKMPRRLVFLFVFLCLFW